MGCELKGERRSAKAVVITTGRRARRLKPVLLALENRRLLSTFTVESTADDGTPARFGGRLPGELDSGREHNRLRWPALTPQTIDLAAGQLELSGPQTITGPVAGVTINAGGNTRVVAITQALSHQSRV